MTPGCALWLRHGLLAVLFAVVASMPVGSPPASAGSAFAAGLTREAAARRRTRASGQPFAVMRRWFASR